MRSRITVGVAAACLMLTACGAATSTSTSSVSSAVRPPASTGNPTPSSTSWGTATYVVGTVSNFDINEGTVSTVAPDGTSHSRGGSFTYDLHSDDPRVSGSVTGTWNTDRWGEEDDGALVQWGDATLTNSKGTWVATWSGAMASPVGDMISRWWTGTGAYNGQTFYFWMQATDISDPTTTWHGVIYTGDPPPGAHAN